MLSPLLLLLTSLCYCAAVCVAVAAFALANVAVLLSCCCYCCFHCRGKYCCCCCLNFLTVYFFSFSRLRDLRLSDAGTYVCRASNAAGSASARASLSVSRPAAIPRPPRANVQVVSSERRAVNVTLECGAVGSPSPLVFWSKEERAEDGGEGILMFPGGVYEGGRIRVDNDGRLTILGARPNGDGGHFSCSAANAAGAAIARSTLAVHDEEDFEQQEVFDSESEEVRARLSSPDLVLLRAARAVGQGSVKLAWEVPSERLAKFISGFRVWFRRVGSSDFRSVEVAHPEVRSFVVTRLDGYAEHEFFVQPFAKREDQGSFTVPGTPSPVVQTRTRPEAPAAAPEILEARLVNASTIFLAWRPLSEEEANGPVETYQVN